MPRQIFCILRRIISGSLCMNFGINEGVFHVLYANKVCAFWSHSYILRHQIDFFRNFPTCLTSQYIFLQLFSSLFLERTYCWCNIENTMHFYQLLQLPWYWESKLLLGLIYSRLCLNPYLCCLGFCPDAIICAHAALLAAHYLLRIGNSITLCITNSIM